MTMPPTDPMAYPLCRVPLRRATNVFGGIAITVHAGRYYDVLEADRRWRAAGGDTLYNIRQGDTGSYNCRPSAAHSRACADDWNWNGNPMGPKRTPCPQEVGMEEFYRECWEPLGYGWGGAWNSKCDAMHISLLKSEGGCGILYRTWAEEDDVDETTFKRWMTEWAKAEFAKDKWGVFKPIYLRFEIDGVSPDGIQAVYDKLTDSTTDG